MTAAVIGSLPNDLRVGPIATENLNGCPFVLECANYRKSIGKEIYVKIESIRILALLWEYTDQFPAANPAQFRDRYMQIPDMLQRVRANHRVETLVRKGQSLDIPFPIRNLFRFSAPKVGNMNVAPGYSKCGVPRRDGTTEITPSTSGVQ